MEEGQEQMREIRVQAGVGFGELWVMKVGGSWRDGAQRVKVGSKLRKVWQGHRLGWDLSEDTRGGFWPEGPPFR